MRTPCSSWRLAMLLIMSVGVKSLNCPEDSVANEDGECKCVSPCPPNKCHEGERPIQVRAGVPETPGSCCPLYECVPLESISWIPDDEKLSRNCIDNSGLPRSIGEHWHQDPCVNCTCEEINGSASLSCYATMCKSCEKPSPLKPGECCALCLEHRNYMDISYSTNTSTNVTITTSTLISTESTTKIPLENCQSLEECEPPCHLSTLHVLDSCPTCYCPNDNHNNDNDNFKNETKERWDKICPELTHCGLNCVLVNDQGGCSVCACQNGSLNDSFVSKGDDMNVIPPNRIGEVNNNIGMIEEDENSGIICPELKCDLHCEHGLVMDENDCTLCQCKLQAIGCPRLTECKKKCPYGYKSNRRKCLTCRCRATCVDHYNETHPEGSSWNPDVCTSCTCDTAGRLICKETICSLGCLNPLPPKPGECCPVCPINEIGKNKNESHQGIPLIVLITLIVLLTLFCIILMIFVARGRFRGRLSPSTTLYTSYPAQYYKCPAYDQNEKIVPL